ncbi:hypothetical protein [Streptomyces xanthophaeus]|uniref:hypothetical protein n=1 Tax=Streptomyces xanthophaeus TaxID=67385 RepID=UPI00233EB172|nr:hypothetical protein [Streptomyces xanthophaeus]
MTAVAVLTALTTTVPVIVVTMVAPAAAAGWPEHRDGAAPATSLTGAAAALGVTVLSRSAHRRPAAC